MLATLFSHKVQHTTSFTEQNIAACLLMFDIIFEYS